MASTASITLSASDGLEYVTSPHAHRGQTCRTDDSLHSERTPVVPCGFPSRESRYTQLATVREVLHSRYVAREHANAAPVKRDGHGTRYAFYSLPWLVQNLLLHAVICFCCLLTPSKRLWPQMTPWMTRQPRPKRIGQHQKHLRIWEGPQSLLGRGSAVPASREAAE